MFIRRRFFLLAAAALIALAALSARALAIDGVPYIGAGGAQRYADGVTEFTDQSDRTLTSGWYVVDSDFTYSNIVMIDGDVRLILADGCDFTVSGGIEVNEGHSLTIYAQSSGGSMGALTANGGASNAGIGGGHLQNGGTITINGGKIEANGGPGAAGIGGGLSNPGDAKHGGTVIINGGEVEATGGFDNNSNSSGAGIGGSYAGRGGVVIISGGKVTARGGGPDSAGIGGGTGPPMAAGGDSGDILIYGEHTDVTAIGGGNGVDDIGAGANGDRGNIFIAVGALNTGYGLPAGNEVAFAANTATSSAVLVTLPSPFNATVPLLFGLGEAGEELLVYVSDSLLGANFTFMMADYRPVTLTGDALNQPGARVGFVEFGSKPAPPPPAVAILYDVEKSGDAFTFKTIIANANTDTAGVTVTVRLNEKFETAVTIGEDGIGRGILAASGFSGNTANVSARPNMPGAASVTTVYQIYGTGEVVRR